MALKQSSEELSSLASRVLMGEKPGWMPQVYWDDVVKRLAGSVLSQDETPQVATPGPSKAQEADWADSHTAKDEDTPW